MEDAPLRHEVSDEDLLARTEPVDASKRQADDSSSSSGSSDGSDDDEPMMVGGSIDTDAFALLEGVAYGKNLDPSDMTRISVPITRIPATLGRSHDTSDESFFGLGPKKALSREQCRIYFQEPNGGRFVFQDDKFVYEPHKGKKRVVIPLEKDDPLPEHGFFAIECLGKNKITVGKNRVEQGQVAQLESGTPIRMSTVCLYFLLPTDAQEETMEIPASKTPRKRPAASASDNEPAAKRQSTGTGNAGPYAALLQEFEELPVDALLQEMKEAIDSDNWDRRHQLMGSVLAYHGVKDASRSKKLRRIARENGAGVGRKEIMDWMEASPKYSFWVRHTLNRVELSSYQSTITKALQKAGYERQGKHGRFVKWKLPPSAEVESEVSDDDEEEAGSSNDEGDDNASDDDVEMAAVGENEGGEDDFSDEDDDGDDGEENRTAGVGERFAGGEEAGDDEGNDSSDSDSGDSSDDNVHEVSKPTSTTKGERSKQDGDDSSNDDSSDDGQPVSNSKADEEMEDAGGSDDDEDDGEGRSSSSGSDSSKDEVTANAANKE